MAFWILDGWGETIDYPTLGFIAGPGDILEATAAPDPRWSSTGSGPETVTRYPVGSDPSYVEPTDGHVLAWSDAENTYVPTAPEAVEGLNGSNITTGTVADARIASTIARDSEVTAAVDAEATLARNASNLTSGTVADARIASTIARDSEVAAAIATAAATNQTIADRIATGQEVFPRTTTGGTVGMTSGVLRLTYFTAYKSETVASLVTATGGTAAGATPTLCKMALFSVDGAGDLTLIGATANDTSLWAATTTKYTKALTSPVAVTAGTRYALAALCVTGATAPVLASRTINAALANDNNRLSGLIGSQADISASYTNASLTTSSAAQFYGELIP